MINQYPFWKYLVLIAVTLLCLLYALPNLYGKDPALLVAPLRSQVMDQAVRDEITTALAAAQLKPVSMGMRDEKLEIRFANTQDQLKAAERLGQVLEGRFVPAMTLVSGAPSWLRSLGAEPMFLGLDLQGGVHFLMEVDMKAALVKAYDRYASDIKAELREKKIYITGLTDNERGITIRFRTAELRDQAPAAIRALDRRFEITESEADGAFYLQVLISEEMQAELRALALEQNITTLRNRVNELGVAEPIVQQQGDRRIILQLPGVQDPNEARALIGKTATIEVHEVDERSANAQAIMQGGRPPVGTRIYKERNGNPVLLKKRAIFTGESITHAASTFDQRSGSHAVSITLDEVGGKRWNLFTKDHVKDYTAVVYKEVVTRSKVVDGKPIKVSKTIEEVISVARIAERLGRVFQITGLDDAQEARNLAILLRAGALAAPIEIIEERTVGPSLGRDHVDQGFLSVLIGFLLVLVFMAVYYKLFGLVANVALAMNLVIIVALLSLMQATLTLPGIAGIVLTVGMAVDANVLIFERIREEIRAGNSPQASIFSGYEKALSTIADANITTLIAALVLFGFGSGPIKGFAITLSLGILSSMFTAIMGTRGIINLIYGGRTVKRLAI